MVVFYNSLIYIFRIQQFFYRCKKKNMQKSKFKNSKHGKNVWCSNEKKIVWNNVLIFEKSHFTPWNKVHPSIHHYLFYFLFIRQIPFVFLVLVAFVSNWHWFHKQWQLKIKWVIYLLAFLSDHEYYVIIIIIMTMLNSLMQSKRNCVLLLI